MHFLQPIDNKKIKYKNKISFLEYSCRDVLAFQGFHIPKKIFYFSFCFLLQAVGNDAGTPHERPHATEKNEDEPTEGRECLYRLVLLRVVFHSLSDRVVFLHGKNIIGGEKLCSTPASWPKGNFSPPIIFFL